MNHSESIALAEQRRHDLLADAAAARSGRLVRGARTRAERRWFGRRRSGH
jgi:hypothetical protein